VKNEKGKLEEKSPGRRFNEKKNGRGKNAR
jgi:hypothetical protein